MQVNPSRRLVGSVTVHVFEEIDDAGAKRHAITPLIFIEHQGPDFGIVARALQRAAQEIAEQGSPLILPPSLGSN